MYAAATALDPDSIYQVSLLAFAEMAAAGYVAVGEFHYPHHRPDGSPYADPNAMARAVARAAADAGIEIVLLMTAYERGGAGRPPTPGQRRFCDPSVDAYLDRVEALAADGVAVGLAPHSVRAVSRPWLERIASYAAETGMVVHIHANEQRRELDECLAEYGRRPVELLADVGLLGQRTTLVHATHVTDGELDLIAQAGASVCACPTTEANLGDGFLPAARLFERGIADVHRVGLQHDHRPTGRTTRNRDHRPPPGRAPKRAGAGPGSRADALPAGCRAAATALARWAYLNLYLRLRLTESSTTANRGRRRSDGRPDLRRQRRRAAPRDTLNRPGGM